MGGYFGVERDFLDSDFWLAEPFTKAQAWIDLFGIANHSDGFFFKRGMKITVLRGQIGRSELTLSARWGWSRNKVRRFLKWLEKEVMISLKQDNKTTIITICNYDIYQGKKHVNDTTNDTTERHQKDTKRNTNKNVNKEKKNKVKNTFSNEFEECWKIVPRREGTKQGKKPAGILFEKLSLEDKRKCYFGLENYSMFCEKSGQPAMDFEKFIRNCIFDDYQKKIIVPDKSPRTTSDQNAEFFENRKKQQTGNQCVIAK